MASRERKPAVEISEEPRHYFIKRDSTDPGWRPLRICFPSYSTVNDYFAAMKAIEAKRQPAKYDLRALLSKVHNKTGPI
jgi:hypothetical protein